MIIKTIPYRELTRSELYDLVWSKPMRDLAASFGISDVAMKKRCGKANIPVPGRGYWARVQSGKRVSTPPLPPRFPGTSDKVYFGSKHHSSWNSWPNDALKRAIPPEPVFEESVETLTARVRKMVGRVSYRADFVVTHPDVAALLAQDEVRRKEYARFKSPYYAPKYDDGVERRRLLILNSLFLAFRKLDCQSRMSTSKYASYASEDRTIRVHVGSQSVDLTLEPIKLKGKNHSGANPQRLRLVADPHSSARQKIWDEEGKKRIEHLLTEIVTAILVHAEVSYRNDSVAQRKWVIEEKARAEREIARRKAEADRLERERIERDERERVDRLLAQSVALGRANTIRRYVRLATRALSSDPKLQPKLSEWCLRALRIADSQDPIVNGAIVAELQE